MPRPSTAPGGVLRALQLVLSPIGALAKVATGIVLFVVLIAAGLIWAFNAWVSTLLPRPRQPAKPPAEVRELMSRLASVSPFQGLTPKDTCKPHTVALSSSPTDSCWFDFGKASVRVTWNTETGRVWSVILQTSIPDAERAAYQSVPLGWLDFPAAHRIFCPRSSDPAAVMASLPHRLAQMPWVRRDGGPLVPAGPGELNATRSVVAGADGCGARLTETRGKDQLQITLAYPVLGQGF